jgi:mannose PTS system EIID component
MTFPARARWTAWLRSFSIQASFNFETLIGTGFAFMLHPLLRIVYVGRPAALDEALARHALLFNSHPYLATLAAGAVARLEADGVAPEVIERFKAALRGSLGAIGDQLVWRGWRPATALLGVAVLLLGAPGWLGVGVFLVAYNTMHLYLRGWGLRVGLDSGLGVARVLRDAPFAGWATASARAGAFLGGLAAVAALRGLPLAGAVGAAAVVALVAGYGLGANARRTAWTLLGVLWVGGLAYAALSAPIP